MRHLIILIFLISFTLGSISKQDCTIKERTHQEVSYKFVLLKFGEQYKPAIIFNTNKHIYISEGRIPLFEYKHNCFILNGHSGHLDCWIDNRKRYIHYKNIDFLKY